MACEHSTLDGNIQHYRFTEPSRRAIDEFIAHLERVIPTLPLDQPHLALIDIRESGMPSLAYLSTQMRKYVNQLEYRLKSRVVIVYGSGTVYTMVNTAIQMFTRRDYDEIRFVQGDLDEAIAWFTVEMLTE